MYIVGKSPYLLCHTKLNLKQVLVIATTKEKSGKLWNGYRKTLTKKSTMQTIWNE